jgi:hypothetical protein
MILEVTQLIVRGIIMRVIQQQLAVILAIHRALGDEIIKRAGQRISRTIIRGNINADCTRKVVQTAAGAVPQTTITSSIGWVI